MRARGSWPLAVLVVSAVAQAQSFSGTWTSELGTLALKQQGTRVTGTATVGGASNPTWDGGATVRPR